MPNPTPYSSSLSIQDREHPKVRGSKTVSCIPPMINLKMLSAQLIQAFLLYIGSSILSHITLSTVYHRFLRSHTLRVLR
jgi:hypothetical protein